MDSQSITATPPLGAPLLATPKTAAPAADKSADVAKQAKAAPAPAPPPAEPHITIKERDPRSLQYQVDSETHQVLATIVDDKNKTVIQQIPDAELLRIAQSIGRMQGFLLVGKA